MNLKSVELVRKIRDENYQNCRSMTTQERIEYTKRLANKFSLIILINRLRIILLQLFKG